MAKLEDWLTELDGAMTLVGNIPVAMTLATAATQAKLAFDHLHRLRHMLVELRLLTHSEGEDILRCVEVAAAGDINKALRDRMHAAVNRVAAEPIWEAKS